MNRSTIGCWVKQLKMSEGHGKDVSRPGQDYYWQGIHTLVTHA